MKAPSNIFIYSTTLNSSQSSAQIPMDNVSTPTTTKVAYEAVSQGVNVFGGLRQGHRKVSFRCAVEGKITTIIRLIGVEKYFNITKKKKEIATIYIVVQK